MCFCVISHYLVQIVQVFNMCGTAWKCVCVVDPLGKWVLYAGTMQRRREPSKQWCTTCNMDPASQEGGRNKITLERNEKELKTEEHQGHLNKPTSHSIHPQYRHFLCVHVQYCMHVQYSTVCTYSTVLYAIVQSKQSLHTATCSTVLIITHPARSPCVSTGIHTDVHCTMYMYGCLGLGSGWLVARWLKLCQPLVGVGSPTCYHGGTGLPSYPIPPALASPAAMGTQGPLLIQMDLGPL